MISCISYDKDFATAEKSSDDNNTSSMRSSLNSEVYAMYVNNGSAVACSNNILVFPSWKDYHDAIEKLDKQVELSIDAFDVSINAANLSDDAYDAICESNGFDEDNVLLQFESELDFCSLRKIIAHKETLWLDKQGDGQWNADEDPDNHFIDDESERSLLNDQGEVAIKDDRGNIVIYHFNDDAGNYIEIHNMDINALQQINAGAVPQNNPNVVIVKPENIVVGDCKFKITEVVYEDNGTNRFKRTSKIRRAVGTTCDTYTKKCSVLAYSKIKAKTKGYKKRNGKWRGGRTTIAAGLFGSEPSTAGLRNIDCVKPQAVNEYNIGRQRRIKVIVKKGSPYIPLGFPTNYNNGVQDNKLFSYHSQANLFVNKDFYDMPEN